MIPYSIPYISNSEVNNVEKALYSTWISGGEFCDSFRNALSGIMGRSSVTLTSNGTSAIELAYITLATAPADRIIFPAFGFMAGVNVALNYGLIPVFADVDPETWVVTPETIAEAYSDYIYAIFVTHTYGNMANIFSSFTDDFIIEDCAESFMSRLNGKLCGLFGTVGTFSFHSTKTITTGEGGMLVSKKESLVRYATRVASHGLSERGTYNHTIPGMNFRMSNVLAAIGLAQVEKLPNILYRKKDIYNRYASNLKHLKTQKITDGCDPVMWVYPIDTELTEDNRNDLVKRLYDKGIEVRPGFTSPLDIPYMKQYVTQKIPVADRLSKSVISLPAYYSMTDNQIDYICENLIKELK